MHFVDQVDLVTAPAGCVLHVIEQLASVFNLGAAGGVNFDQINKAAFVDFPADRALPAGGCADAGFAVQAFGQNPRNSGITDPTSAGK